MNLDFLFLAFLYQKNPIIAAIKYGMEKRYKIPKFNPAPMLVSPLLTLFSIDARHMAHCAYTGISTTINKTTIRIDFMIGFILRKTSSFLE
jgi:hypothetical protein